MRRLFLIFMVTASFIACQFANTKTSQPFSKVVKTQISVPIEMMQEITPVKITVTEITEIPSPVTIDGYADFTVGFTTTVHLPGQESKSVKQSFSAYASTREEASVSEMIKEGIRIHSLIEKADPKNIRVMIVDNQVKEISWLGPVVNGIALTEILWEPN